MYLAALAPYFFKNCRVVSLHLHLHPNANSNPNPHTCFLGCKGQPWM